MITHSNKFRLLVFLWFFFIALIPIKGNSQSITEKDIVQFANEIREMDSIGKLIIFQRIDQSEKDTFFLKLNHKYNTERARPETLRNNHKVSLFAYESYVAQARSYAEKIKLWQLEQIAMLKNNMGKSDFQQLERNYFNELIKKRNDHSEILEKRAKELAPYITTDYIKNQFELFVSRL